MQCRVVVMFVAAVFSGAALAKQPKSIGKIKTANEAPIDAVVARKAIESANQDFVVALKKKDMKYITDAFEPDAVLMVPGVDGIYGREQIAKYFSAFVASYVIDETGSVTQDVTVAAHTAYETGLYTMSTHSGSSPVTADHGKYLCVWKRDDDGHWRIVREIFNTSVPMAAPKPSQHGDRVG